MELDSIHISFMLLTIVFVIGCGVLPSLKMKSSDSFSINGRHSSQIMVTGAIAGTCIGGGATIGTSQMAFSFGLSAWWFTIGIGLGLLIMAIFLAKPIRNTKLETISQILVLSYGKKSGPSTSLISSIGIFFACVSSVLPAIYLLAHILNISVLISSFILLILICSYIFFGGIKSASISGIIKTVILGFILVNIGYVATNELNSLQNFNEIFHEDKWFNLFSLGTTHTIKNIFSLLIGVICGQSYVQAILSATNAKAAKIGTLIAACISIPVGLPCVLAAMCMYAEHPNIQPILALPLFITTHLNSPIAGIGLGVIMIALISSISGLMFGLTTMLTKDFINPIFKLKDDRYSLLINRIFIIVITICVIVFSIFNIDSQILHWNILSMALRGCIFIPLILAIFYPKKLQTNYAFMITIITLILFFCL